MPSEPITIRSGLGPAPDPGSLLDSITPVGVTIVVDSTKSSICVYRVAKCPPDLVAIHPPKVECSKLWGKCLRVRLDFFSSSSKAGPNIPACILAALLSLSISKTWFRFLKSREITPE